MKSIPRYKQENDVIFCQICNKKLRSQYYLQIHMAVHTGEKNYICGLCGKGYQQKWNLITHMARIHLKEKPFKCNDCGKAFGYSSHFKRHVKMHFLEKIKAPEVVKRKLLNPFECDVCNKNFESRYKLNLHTRTHQPLNDKDGSRSIETQSQYMVQNKIKRNGKQAIMYQQNIDCSSLVFGLDAEVDSRSRAELQTVEVKQQINDLTEEDHEHSILQKDLVACETSSQIISGGPVKRPLNVHCTEQFFCQYCRKRFLSSGKRLVHERKHSGEKSYLCDVCGKGLTQYKNLLRHRKHHNLLSKDSQCKEYNSIIIDQNSIMKTETLRLTLEKPKPRDNFVEFTHAKNVENNENFGNCDNMNTELENKKNSYWTGEETLEEFLCIARQRDKTKLRQDNIKNWKPDVIKHSNGNPLNFGILLPDVFDKLPSIQGAEIKFVCGSGYENEIKDVMTKLNMKEKNLQVKEIKRKMNKSIYEKIVENLLSTDAKNKVSAAMEIINNRREGHEGNILKEFLKLMKTVPDNAVMQTKGGRVFWHCWICESALKTRHLLARHLLIHEPEENRPYKCQACIKTFTQFNNFKEHLLYHNQKNQFYCEKCGVGFRHKSHFNVHVREHASIRDNILTKCVCNYCGKRLNTNVEKLKHEITHTNKGKPYFCKVCGLQFTILSNLSNHQMTHATITHQCILCLKSFKRKFSLKRHYVTHFEQAQDKIFCDCGKKFSQKSSLKKHKIVCENKKQPVSKPFSCSKCLKKFLTNSDLKRHLATHDSSKKFKCSFCLNYLKTAETFKRHLQRHKSNLI